MISNQEDDTHSKVGEEETEVWAAITAATPEILTKTPLRPEEEEEEVEVDDLSYISHLGPVCDFI